MTRRTQQRGPITDYFEEGPKVRVWTDGGHRHERVALCVCKHGTEWPEGGYGCVECIAEWQASPECVAMRTGKAA